MAEIDGLEPDTEYIVRVRTHVAGADGAPASVVVRTGEWLPASCFWLLCISDCYPCSLLLSNLPVHTEPPMVTKCVHSCL